MQINIITFFTLILLVCNIFGMEKQSSKEQVVHLAVNKSETLLSSVSHDLGMGTNTLNIWRIIATKPEATHLLKMDGPKSFLQALPQELVAELQKFTRCCVPQDLEKIQSINFTAWKTQFDSDDNLYFLDDKRNLQIWRKQDTNGKINYYQIYSLPNIVVYCLNSNAVITSFNDKSIKIYRILKKSDPEKPIVIEAAQLIPSRCGVPYNLSDNSFFVVDNANVVKVYKKDKGDPYYMRRKKIKGDVNAERSVFKGPSESIIIINGSYGQVWLQENNSSDKPSYRFEIKTRGRWCQVIKVDELGRLYLNTPHTIDIYHNDPRHPRDYERIANLSYAADSPVILSPSGTLFIGQHSKIKIWHQLDHREKAGFKEIVAECIANERKEKKEAVRAAKIERRAKKRAERNAAS